MTLQVPGPGRRERDLVGGHATVVIAAQRTNANWLHGLRSRMHGASLVSG